MKVFHWDMDVLGCVTKTWMFWTFVCPKHSYLPHRYEKDAPYIAESSGEGWWNIFPARPLWRNHQCWGSTSLQGKTGRDLSLHLSVVTGSFPSSRLPNTTQLMLEINLPEEEQGRTGDAVVPRKVQPSAAIISPDLSSWAVKITLP